MATTTANTSAHQVIITAMAELIGVSVIAIIADTSESMGKAMVALMLAFLLLFLIGPGSAWINSLTKKL